MAIDLTNAETTVKAAAASVLTQSRKLYIYATLADMILSSLVGLIISYALGGTFGVIAGTLLGFVLFAGLLYCFVRYWEPRFIKV